MLTQKLERKIIRLASEIVFVRKPARPIHLSFLARKSNVLAIGINKTAKTSPLANSPYRRIHSEIDVISKIKDNKLFPRLKLINLRVNRNGQFLESCPCQYCKVVIESFGIKNVIFTTGLSEIPNWSNL